jgi:hypothetical protein
VYPQARKDLQLMSARGDQLQGVVQELQKGLGLVVEDQGILEHRMAQVLQKLRAASDPQRNTQPQPNTSQMKVNETYCYNIKNGGRNYCA